MGPEEDLLRHLLGLRPVAEHAERYAEDPMLIRPDQLLKRQRLPCPEPREERRRVGGVLLTHC